MRLSTVSFNAGVQVIMGTFRSLLRFQRRPEPDTTVCTNDIDRAEGISEVTNDPSLEPALVTGYTGQAPRFNLFAVIIGIDGYTNCRPLRGAVADANAVKEYLQETLKVPDNHILTLLDGQATRAAIINAFRKLRDDQRIGKFDSILIFFAGHGSEICPPSAWHMEGRIQLILPYDYGKLSGSTGIRPIPDHTIGALIDDIENEKGDNIIVIFDCCFAGGGDRVDDDEGYIPRTEILDPNIIVKDVDLDQGILEARHGGLPEVFSGQGLRSHVLLAGSGEAELAYEHEGRGLFTLALLKTLKESDISDITYVEITERIPNLKRGQSPRCAGLNKERAVFDARVPERRKVLYPAQLDRMGSLVIDAGQAHGVSHGVEFTLYDQRKTRLGTVEVDRGAEVKDFHTKVTMSEADDWRGASSVTLSRVGEVLFHPGQGWNSSPKAMKTLQRMVDDGTSELSFRLVKDSAGARLEVAVENDQVNFKILDQRTKRFGLTKLPYTATLDNVDRILNAAARYHWYLHYTNSRSTNHKVDVDLYMLKVGLDEDKKEYRFPDGPGLCRKDSVDSLDVIDFVVTPNAYYGIKIKNNTTRDLYLNAFLFNSDLSIVPYRIQSSRGNPEAPLKQNGSLTIGYGSSEERPFEYWLDKDQDVDVGYLKLFFANQPIDVTDVLQDSPFDGSGKTADGPEARMGRPGQVEEVGDAKDIWFTEMIPIVQRRLEP